jgi:RNA-directed DNA polymerase
VSTNLTRIGDKARAHPDLVFTSLYHHIADIDHLRACYRLFKGNKAVGVDGVTKAMYAEDLETNPHSPGFSGRRYSNSSKASRSEDVQIEHPVGGG